MFTDREELMIHAERTLRSTIPRFGLSHADLFLRKSFLKRFHPTTEAELEMALALEGPLEGYPRLRVLYLEEMVKDGFDILELEESLNRPSPFDSAG